MLSFTAAFAACASMCYLQGGAPVPWHTPQTAHLGDAGRWSVESHQNVTWRRGRDVHEHAPTESDLRALAFVTPSIGWVVGDDGVIVQTRDAGRRWEAQTSGTEATLTAVACASAERCFVVDEDGGVLATVDGGRRWTRVGGLSEEERGDGAIDVVDLFFLDGQLGWMIANHAGGGLYATRDGGQRWSRVPVADDDQPLRPTVVRFANEQTGWIAVGQRVFRTADGGASWTASLDVGDELRVAGIAVQDAATLYAVVEGGCDTYLREGTTYISEDGGWTWREWAQPWEESVDWESRVRARLRRGPLRRLSLIHQWDEHLQTFTDVRVTRNGLEERAVSLRARQCGDTDVVAQRQTRAQSLMEWTAGFDPCRLEPEEVSWALSKFAAGRGATRRLVAHCGDVQRTFDVPDVYRRALKRNSPSLLRLVELADRFYDVSYASSPERRRDGAAEVPRLRAGDYDAILPDVAPLRALLAKYQGPVPLGRTRTVRWVEPTDVRPIDLTLPIYPAIAAAARMTGRVELAVFIDGATGAVEDVRAVAGLPLLDTAAVEAARKWRFASRPWPRPLRVVLEYALDACAPGGELDDRH